MKNTLQLLLNLMLFIEWIIRHLTLFIWFGKLPKVSPYHSYESEIKVKDVFNNSLIQSKEFPAPLTLKDKLSIVDELMNNEKCYKYLIQDVPMIDSDGKKYGTHTLYSLIKKPYQMKIAKIINKL